MRGRGAKACTRLHARGSHVQPRQTGRGFIVAGCLVGGAGGRGGGGARELTFGSDGILLFLGRSECAPVCPRLSNTNATGADETVLWCRRASAPTRGRPRPQPVLDTPTEGPRRGRGSGRTGEQFSCLYTFIHNTEISIAKVLVSLDSTCTFYTSVKIS